jgi:hypothetical protein
VRRCVFIVREEGVIGSKRASRKGEVDFLAVVFGAIRPGVEEFFGEGHVVRQMVLGWIRDLWLVDIHARTRHAVQQAFGDGVRSSRCRARVLGCWPIMTEARAGRGSFARQDVSKLTSRSFGGLLFVDVDAFLDPFDQQSGARWKVLELGVRLGGEKTPRIMLLDVSRHSPHVGMAEVADEAMELPRRYGPVSDPDQFPAPV